MSVMSFAPHFPISVVYSTFSVVGGSRYRWLTLFQCFHVFSTLIGTNEVGWRLRRCCSRASVVLDGPADFPEFPARAGGESGADFVQLGVIPARAGEGSVQVVFSRTMSGHPSSRGGGHQLQTTHRRETGSSPRVRGRGQTKPYFSGFSMLVVALFFTFDFSRVALSQPPVIYMLELCAFAVSTTGGFPRSNTLPGFNNYRLYAAFLRLCYFCIVRLTHKKKEG